MRTFHVTTIPKSGSHLELTNDKDIFIVSVLRKILMQILYKRKYTIIDKNMSESNIALEVVRRKVLEITYGS